MYGQRDIVVVVVFVRIVVVIDMILTVYDLNNNNSSTKCLQIRLNKRRFKKREKKVIRIDSTVDKEQKHDNNADERRL